MPLVEMVQDDSRERRMLDMFGLLPGAEGRMGTDAVDEHGNRYELKSATKSGVTTGRDVGLHTLQRYRSRYWIICKGVNRISGFEFEECRFLSPELLEGWFRTIEDRLKPDLVLLERVLAVMRNSEFSETDMDRMKRIVMRGYTLNNPKILWHYVVSHGIRIEGDPKEAVRRLVALHPLRVGPETA